MYDRIFISRKTYFAALVFISLFLSSYMLSSDEDRDIKKLKTLSKAELIELALHDIGENVDIHLFDISISASRKYVQVDFNLPEEIKYIPFNSSSVYGIHVNLTDKTVHYDVETNFKRGSKQRAASPSVRNLFRPTESNRKESKNVIKALKKHDDYNYAFEDENMNDAHVVAKEREKYYEIAIYYFDHEQYCRLHKKSWKITDQHSSVALALPPDPDDVYEEITD